MTIEHPRAARAGSGKTKGRRRTAAPYSVSEVSSKYQGRTNRSIANGVTKLLSSAEPSQREAIDRAAQAKSDNDSLPTAYWGPSPSNTELGTALIDSLVQQFGARERLESTSLSRAQVAALLRISAQAVTEALDQGRLLGLKQGRRWFIPAWQLDAESTRGVLPGIPEVVNVFPGGLISLSTWMTKPHASLDRNTPRDFLRRGRVEAVVALAQGLDSTGW